MKNSVTFEIIGEQQLVCEGCEQRVARAVKELSGVESVSPNARKQRIGVIFNAAILDVSAIVECIRKVGYETRVVNSISNG